MRHILFMTLMAVSACSGSGYKTPSLSGDPARMSADTLCYRYAYAKSDPKLAAEVTARNLDCAAILEDH